MVVILYTGIAFILISIIVNLIETRKFWKALINLNMRTRTTYDRLAYLFRFFGLLPLLFPVIPDIISMLVGMYFGLSNGFYGFILGTAGSCMLTLGIKVMLWFFKHQAQQVEAV